MKEKAINDSPKTPFNLLAGSIGTFISSIFLVMAFSSPYWLVSWHSTYSPFLKMGLWEFCFRHFRFPSFQFDEVFDGCNYIFSFEYKRIWEWLLPAWLMAVQAFMTLGLIFCLSSLITLSMYLTRWPLKWTQKYGSTFIGIASMLDAITSVCMFLSVAVFGGQCWRRDWLLYPNYNYLSWSYGFAVISFFGFALSSYVLYQVIMTMYPNFTILSYNDGITKLILFNTAKENQIIPMPFFVAYTEYAKDVIDLMTKVPMESY